MTRTMTPGRYPTARNSSRARPDKRQVTCTVGSDGSDGEDSRIRALDFLPTDKRGVPEGLAEALVTESTRTPLGSKDKLSGIRQSTAVVLGKLMGDLGI